MKKIFLILVVCVAGIFWSAGFVSATTYYWVGGTTNADIDNLNNWNTSSGACADNAGGDTPTSGDDVIFTSSCTNSATINTAWSINSLTVNASYTGTITQNANLTIAGAYAQSAGTFTTASPTVYSFSVGGSFSLATSSTTFDRYTGSGTSVDPFMIRDVYDLQAMSSSLNAIYKLNSDIDATYTKSTALGGHNWNAGAGFIPVGYSAASFGGSLKGNNYKIDGLYISQYATGTYIGLFGVARLLDAGDTIENLGLTNVNISGHADTGALAGALQNYAAGSGVKNIYVTGTITGTAYTGSIAGYWTYGDGAVSNSYSNANVNVNQDYGGGLFGAVIPAGATISNCHYSGTMTITAGTENYYEGGIAGQMGNTGAKVILTNSYNTGSVTGAGSGTGGLVGRLYASVITNSYNTGNVSSNNNWVVGGLAGTTVGATISYSYNTGTTYGHSRVGGIAGSIDATTFILNSYSTGTVTTYNAGTAGGLVGLWAAGATMQYCYSIGNVTGAAASANGGLIGTDSVTGVTASYYDNQVVVITKGTNTNNGTPTAGLKSQSALTSNGWTFSASGWKINDGITYPKLYWQNFYYFVFKNAVLKFKNAVLKFVIK